MGKPYFIRVTEQSPTMFWINNPTRKQAEKAIANGALGCTNNPSYTQKMIDHPDEKEYALRLLDESIRECGDDWETAEIFQRKMVKPVSDMFMPMFKQSNGQHGYVSIQGDPIHEEDPQVIIDEGRKNRQMSPNIMIKIPATRAGLEAMGVLIEENTPLNATEIMATSPMPA